MNDLYGEWISFRYFDVRLERIAGSLDFIEKMCEFGVVTLELNALNPHEVTFAAPLGYLWGASLIEVTASRWQQDQSDLEAGSENFVQVLAGQLVKNPPFNIHNACITSLQVLVLHSQVKWMLLAICLCHRCLFIIVHTLQLLHLFQITICEYLMHLS